MFIRLGLSYPLVPLALGPWVPPRATVHSKSVSALEPSVVYHSLYGQRQTRYSNDHTLPHHDRRFVSALILVFFVYILSVSSTST